MKKIIVPTDFSECAENALKVAAEIAKKQPDSEVHLVHCYERPVSGYTMQFEIDNDELHKLKDEIKKTMHELSERDYMDGVHTISHYVPDEKITELPKLNVVPDADLIVMGSHGISGMKEIFIGSNTQRVVQLSDIPVLVIKEPVEDFTMKNFVFASNFYSEADKAFNKIKKLAAMFSANIHLLKVTTRNNFEPTHYSYQLMDGFAKEVGLTDYTKHIYNDESIEEGVLHYANQIDADVISIETHGRTGLAHIVNGSVTEHIVNHIARPILTVKIDEPKRDYGVIFPHVSSDSVPSV